MLQIIFVIIFKPEGWHLPTLARGLDLRGAHIPPWSLLSFIIDVHVLLPAAWVVYYTLTVIFTV